MAGQSTLSLPRQIRSWQRSRSDIFPNINRRYAVTIYPPLPGIFWRSRGQRVGDGNEGAMVGFRSSVCVLVDVHPDVWPTGRVAVYAWHRCRCGNLPATSYRCRADCACRVGMGGRRGRAGSPDVPCGCTLTKLYPAVLCRCLSAVELTCDGFSAVTSSIPAVSARWGARFLPGYAAKKGSMPAGSVFICWDCFASCHVAELSGDVCNCGARYSSRSAPDHFIGDGP